MRVKISKAIKTNHAEVESIIRRGFVGVNSSAVEVHVKASWRTHRQQTHFPDGTWKTTSRRVMVHTMSGTAYDGVPTIAHVAARTRYLVTIHIPASPDNSPYPTQHKDWRLKTGPEVELRHWQDSLLHVAAHEAYHIKQYRTGMRRSELRAEKHAAKILAQASSNSSLSFAPRAVAIASALSGVTISPF